MNVFFFVIDYSPISYQQFMPVRKQFKITFAERGRNFFLSETKL